jgi:hypothetical protein
LWQQLSMGFAPRVEMHVRYLGRVCMTGSPDDGPGCPLGFVGRHGTSICSSEQGSAEIIAALAPLATQRSQLAALAQLSD